MRLDKFLQVSRIIKRRTVVTKLCQHGRVQVNGQKAKAGRTLVVGDILSIRIGEQEPSVYEVIKLPSGAVSKEKAPDLYQNISAPPRGNA
jgi:ribosomal 50S subunit-recycling heat shock protein